MWSIHKLPVYLSLILAIITVTAGLANGEDFGIIAYKVSIVIISAYFFGLIVKKILVGLAKEMLQARYAAMIEKKRAMKKTGQNNIEDIKIVESAVNKTHTN